MRGVPCRDRVDFVVRKSLRNSVHDRRWTLAHAELFHGDHDLRRVTTIEPRHWRDNSAFSCMTAGTSRCTGRDFRCNTREAEEKNRRTNVQGYGMTIVHHSENITENPRLTIAFDVRWIHNYVTTREPNMRSLCGAAFIAASFCCILVPASAVAQPITGCFVRTYDSNHLAKNPRQIIRRIQFQVLSEYDPVAYGIRVSLKNDRRPWDAGGGCEPEGSSLRCGLDDDSGRVRITPTKDGVRLDVIDHMSFIADKPDGDLDRKTFSDAAHRTFIMTQAKDSDCKQ